MESRNARMLRRGWIGVFVAGTAGCGGLPPAQDPRPERLELGYAMSEGTRVTGSVSTIRGEELRGSRYSTLIDVLQSRVPGMRVIRYRGGRVDLMIRGPHTFVGNVQPLVIVDGLAISHDPVGALIAIDPADVERIDVLKDSGSTAIFGSRGGNGAIVITTRRGP